MSEDVRADAAAPERHELWQPALRSSRRMILDHVHQRLADDWSRALIGYLGHGDRLSFQGLTLDDFSRVAAAESEDSEALVFSVERALGRVILLVSPELARYLVATRMRAAALMSAIGERTPLTYVEMRVLRGALDIMAERLTAAYSAAGIGHLRLLRRGERLGGTLLFDARDRLTAFHYRVGDESSKLRLALGASSDVVNATREPEGPVRRHASTQLAACAGELPIDVKVVLGTWLAQMADLRALKPGMRITLPPTDDAWLSAGGISLSKVTIEIQDRQIVLEPRGRHRTDGQT